MIFLVVYSRLVFGLRIESSNQKGALTRHGSFHIIKTQRGVTTDERTDQQKLKSKFLEASAIQNGASKSNGMKLGSLGF